MKVTPLTIPDVLLIEPKVIGDERGYFMIAYQRSIFKEATGYLPEAQDNRSLSAKNVLRGLHYQLEPNEQGKLMSVLRGRIFDVAVDIRQGSPTFGKWVGEELSAENKRMLWIPPGFAHGLVALEDNTEILYKQTNEYSPENERGILWNDPAIGINWPVTNPTLSERDQKHPLLKDADNNFTYKGEKK